MKPLRLLVALALLVGGTGFAGSLVLNGALRKGVEVAGTNALGVPTTLESASLGLLSGQLELSKLNIANPPGFGSEPFLQLGTGHVALAVTSLTKDVIELPRLEIDGLTLRLVQRVDGSNYRTLIESLEQPEEAGPAPGPGAPPAPAPEAEPADAKGWIIREVVFRNVHVTGVVEGELGGQGLRREGTIDLPEVRLSDVGEGGEALTLEQQVGRMLEGLLEAVLEDSASVLPTGLGDDLGAVLATGFEQEKLEDMARDRAGVELQKGLDKLFGK